MTSFGQAAFVGIGAYATACADTRCSAVSPWIGLAAGAGADRPRRAGARRCITLRLGGHFLPLSTIAWGIAIYFLFGNVDGLWPLQRA